MNPADSSTKEAALATAHKFDEEYPAPNAVSETGDKLATSSFDQ
jgi:hypothetical protein